MAGEQVMQRDAAKPVEMVQGITRRTLAQTAEAMIVEFELKAGAVLDNHHHPHHQTGYMVSGEAVMFIDGVDYPLQPGATWAITGNVPHGVRVIQDSVVIDCFSPPREDYQD